MKVRICQRKVFIVQHRIHTEGIFFLRGNICLPDFSDVTQDQCMTNNPWICFEFSKSDNINGGATISHDSANLENM